MSKRDRKLTTLFNDETKDTDVTSNSNNDNVTEDVTENSNIVNEEVLQSTEDTPKTSPEATGEVLSVPEGASKGDRVEDAVSEFADILERKKKKLRMEDTHTRSTFLLRNDLAIRLEKLAKKNDRGFKTEFLNKAIELFLDATENKKK